MNTYRAGIDIGSTTVKLVLLDEEGKLLFGEYRRHCAHTQEALSALLREAREQVGDCALRAKITGSGAINLAKALGIPFVQEVVAVADALRREAPQTDVAIELGGEDAKIIYFGTTLEERMNGVCAGGTGSFIDQMAALLQTDAAGLDREAEKYQQIYPIAARCGVFAKTDIQPLINEGATKADLAASIFQAVVNQTISGLACGKPIRGHVAFLGGPLHFLPQLKAAFIRTLKLTDETAIDPPNSHLFAAMGAALDETACEALPIASLIDRLTSGVEMAFELHRLPPLFASQEDYDAFCARHARAVVEKGDLASYTGGCFLGVDAGSTTTKLALIGERGELLWSYYANNQGSPIETAKRAVSALARELPEGAHILRECSTGYGEALLKAAFSLDEGEVETIAHCTAAAFFDPQVDCVLDIGGQDMKCIKLHNGSVDNVLLNEACSSGCGSFIENFAASLGYSAEGFAKEALFAPHPVDLGTRCTVFMNSNVKQAQKEGAGVPDISAGLAYSVIKNALYKVIKLADPSELGAHVVVQGGTFYNKAVLRAFERISGAEAVCPDISGLMGAFGAALIARSHYHGQETAMLPLAEIETLEYKTQTLRCGGCSNRCMLTVTRFPGGRRYTTGNRCEKGAGNTDAHEKGADLFAYKRERLFRYPPLAAEAAPRGELGIPRVLNMYENYPFWATFFKALGFRVILSPLSDRRLYERGMESIPSESECYPAKLAHGHVQWLIDEGVHTIFHPCVFFEHQETPDAQNHFNCPIVVSYPENLKNNVEAAADGEVEYLKPFLAFTSEKTVADRMARFCREQWGIPEKETRQAVSLAWAEQQRAKEDIRAEGARVLKKMRQEGRCGVVLAGRPYHLDPEINHGIPELITSFDMAVLTEDSISHLGHPERPLIVSDQWMYHSRLYAAASYVKKVENLDLIQLNSFGCGLDAVTTDQVNDILSGSDKIYTCLKIDEVNNLGAARIRVRSLLSAIKVREKLHKQRTIRSSAIVKVPFTEEMRKDYTIICPQMSPIHFELLEPAFNACGYHFVVLDNDNKHSVDVGLKYVNNDACYPSLLVVGQIMEALLSGKYDLNKTAIIMSQTGGGCRATNYVGFIRRALKKADMAQIPVISLNLAGIESNPGFHLNADMLIRAAVGAEFGDIFMRCIYRMRPYEATPGSVEAVHQKWLKVTQEFVSAKHISLRKFNKLCKEIIRDFDSIPLLDIKKPRVGIVGEILVKFSPAGNNHLVELLESEGAEAVVPDLIDFMLYCFYNQLYKADHLGMSKKTARNSKLGIWAIEHILRSTATKEFQRSKHFTPPTPIQEIAEFAEPIVSIGNQTGEGWFLTGEMVELIHDGVPNIVCTQPFGCLPNHVVGKGVIKALRKAYPASNIVAIDYDPGASEVNQLNRIKLMLSTAQKNLKAETPDA